MASERQSASRRPAQTGKPRGGRGERTRERIRDAANELFIRDGFKNTTVDAITAAAGVSKGTFYIHFDRKEDLLLEYGVRRLLRARELTPELLVARSFRDAVNEIVDSTVRGKLWDREVTRLAILEMGTDYERLPMESPHEILMPLVQVAQARGEIRDDIPPGPPAQSVMRSILGALRDWGLGTDDLDRDAALDYSLTLAFDAVMRREPPADGTG